MRTSQRGGLGRGAFFAAVLTLFLACALTHARPAHGQDPAPVTPALAPAAPLPDATPTWWHEAAGLTPLLTAPPPPNPATICVIDTGVTPTPDLDITARWAYDGGTLDDVHESETNPGHGTLVAHFAAAAVNGWGSAGAFPYARITSVRVFPREGGASWREYIAAISRCRKIGPETKVILISIGGQEIERGEAEELQHQIDQARDLFAINVVVAAGNTGGQADFPGRFEHAFTVGATDENGALCAFTARGPGIDISAPGCGLSQVGVTGEAWSVAGSSFAAPLVAGALAAIRSYRPEIGVDGSESLLREYGGRGGSELPSLDAAAALTAADIPWKRPTPTTASAASPAAGTPRQPAAAARSAVPRPRVTVRRAHGRIVLIARNLPRDARFEARLRRKRITSRSSRIFVGGRRRTARCRYVVGPRRSAWTTVRW